jgi:signal transduction histidine kinase
LVHISDHLKNFNLKNTNDVLELERPKTQTADELDTLILAINQMREKIDQSYLSLNLLNAELEAKVKSETEIVLDQRLKLEHAAKMTILGEMAGGIAHEINNPITVISATNRMLKKTFEKGITDPAVYAKYFEEMDKTIIRINKIITGLRVVSRDGANEGFQEEKLQDIFNDVIGLCGEKFKNHNVDLRVDLENDIFQTTIKCGRIQLSQVFLNLLGNAYDAIEQNAEKWISIECALIQDKLEIRFTDSGNGIPLELQEKILTPSFTTKVLGKGTGLGLSISNSIIKSHKGEFTIDNNCKNTCFVITFPIHESMDEKISA